MSAIAGVWHPDGRPRAHEELRGMLDALAMYGTDQRGAVDLGEAALGRCLMQVLPEDRHDRQPLVANPEKAWLVADVRLDNREELARKLRLRVSSLQHQSDAQLLLAAWQEWGESCLQHLVGAFCFAVWDARRRHLFLARDHVGYRPLFYHCSPGCFAFATMPKGLLRLPGLAAQLDEEQLALHLALAHYAPERTLFVGIDRLPAGHCLHATPEAVRVVRYWQPDDSPAIRFKRDQDYSDALRERLDVAVGSQLRANCDIAAHLSAGLDSSSVAATAARALATQGGELLAFTSVPRPQFGQVVAGTIGDEGPAAAQVAALHPNMKHLRVSTEGYSVLEVINRNSLLDDGPVFNPANAMWLNAIRDIARQRGTRVVLIGQSGNATLSYAGMDAFAEWFVRGHWWKVAQCGRALVRNGYCRPRSIIGRCIRPWWPTALRSPLTRQRVLPFSLVHPDLVRNLRLRERSIVDTPSGPDARAVARLLLLRNQGADVYTGGRAGWQVDERDPTRDRRIVEFCFGIPPEQFLAGGHTRALVRRAMRDRLPEATLRCKARGLQSADWHLILAAERPGMMRELLCLERSPMAQRCLDLERMRYLLEHWPTTGFERSEVFVPWHLALTRGLSVGHFIRNLDPDAELPSFTAQAEHRHELHAQ
jgi:asparagine synthase (glutamine-hydrolysing)